MSEIRWTKGVLSHSLEELVRCLSHGSGEPCPSCEAEGEAERGEKADRSETPPADYREAYRRALARAGAQAERLVEERQCAAESFQALLDLPASHRLEAVRTEPRRFQGPALASLASLLLEEARGCLPGYPRQAHAFARLAGAVLQDAPVTAYAVQIYSLALAHQGNARRVEGDLAAAEALLEAARLLFAGAGDGDPLAVAEIDHLEGSLRRDQRRLPEALRLLRGAEATYKEQGEEVQAARVLLKLGTAYQEAGDLETASSVTLQALRALPVEAQPRLHLYAVHNLAYLQHCLGRDAEARRTVEAIRSLAESHGDPLSRLRLRSLEGQIARGLGEVERAEGALRSVRRAFFQEDLPYDAALVTLELASLLAENGRTAEVQVLAEELVPLFESRGVHREASTALLLFVDAARAESLTLAFLHELATYLRSARYTPHLPFRQPS